MPTPGAGACPARLARVGVHQRRRPQQEGILITIPLAGRLNETQGMLTLEMLSNAEDSFPKEAEPGGTQHYSAYPTAYPGGAQSRHRYVVSGQPAARVTLPKYQNTLDF